MIFSRILTLIYTLTLPVVCAAQHKVEGKLNDPSGKWGRIHLEYIPSIENLTHLMAKNVLGGSSIDSAGNFLIEGIGLPAGKHLYRLFLMKKSTSNGSYGISDGSVRNYNLIVLDDYSQLNLQSSDVSSSFAYCNFLNNPESQAIAQLYDQITAPILNELTKDTSTHPSELKVQMLSKRESDLLKNFADTTNYIIPGIIALQLLPDFEAAFKENPAFFRRFSMKITKREPYSPYVIEFKTKVEALDKKLFGERKDWTKPMLYFFMGLSGFLLALVFRLKTKLKWYEVATVQPIAPDKAVLETLSPKELEVLQQLADGKSNKEIAQSLFIETSTVKSHVNKIYQKLNISTRQEARQWADLVEKP